MARAIIWRGDPLDCQYCKQGKFPHDHEYEHRKIRSGGRIKLQPRKAPPRTIQQTLEFGEQTIDCE